MGNAGLLLTIVAVGLSALVQVATDPRITKEFRRRSYWALLVYAVIVGVPVVALILSFAALPERGDYAAIGLGVAVLGWVGLGGLLLVRMAPRLREPPGWMLRFGLADILLLALVAFGLALIVGLIPG